MWSPLHQNVVGDHFRRVVQVPVNFLTLLYGNMLEIAADILLSWRDRDLRTQLILDSISFIGKNTGVVESNIILE